MRKHRNRARTRLPRWWRKVRDEHRYMVTRKYLCGQTPDEAEKMERLGRRLDAVFASGERRILKHLERIGNDRMPVECETLDRLITQARKAHALERENARLRAEVQERTDTVWVGEAWMKRIRAIGERTQDGPATVVIEAINLYEMALAAPGRGAIVCILPTGAVITHEPGEIGTELVRAVLAGKKVPEKGECDADTDA